MAAEAEAAREARAKVIAAEGEQKASRALKEASMVIAQSPAALQLRYLQVSHRLVIHQIKKKTNQNIPINSKRPPSAKPRLPIPTSDAHSAQLRA
jgi:hypothetical protein